MFRAVAHCLVAMICKQFAPLHPGLPINQHARNRQIIIPAVEKLSRKYGNKQNLAWPWNCRSYMFGGTIAYISNKRKNLEYIATPLNKRKMNLSSPWGSYVHSSRQERLYKIGGELCTMGRQKINAPVSHLSLQSRYSNKRSDDSHDRHIES